MDLRPPPLSNGYVWTTHTLIRPERLRELEDSLAVGIRHQMKKRHLHGYFPPYSDEIEVWVHPDDLGRVAPLMRRALDESGPASGESPLP